MEAIHARSAHLRRRGSKLTSCRGTALGFSSFLPGKYQKILFLAKSTRKQEAQATHLELAGMAPPSCRQDLALPVPQAGETPRLLRQKEQWHPLPAPSAAQAGVLCQHRLFAGHLPASSSGMKGLKISQSALWIRRAPPHTQPCCLSLLMSHLKANRMLPPLCPPRVKLCQFVHTLGGVCRVVLGSNCIPQVPGTALLLPETGPAHSHSG